MTPTKGVSMSALNPSVDWTMEERVEVAVALLKRMSRSRLDLMQTAFLETIEKVLTDDKEVVEENRAAILETFLGQ